MVAAAEEGQRGGRGGPNAQGASAPVGSTAADIPPQQSVPAGDGQTGSARRGRAGGRGFGRESDGGDGGRRRGENGGFSGGGGRRNGRGREGAPAAPQPTRTAQGGADTIDALFAPLPPVASRGRVWQFMDRQLKPVDVRLGITDGTFTELADGQSLDADAQVVTGMTGLTARTPTGPAGDGNPFQQGGAVDAAEAGASSRMPTVISVRSLVKTYVVGEVKVHALRGVTWKSAG